MKIARERMKELFALPSAGHLTWNFETHDEWIKGADTRLILDAIPDPTVGSEAKGWRYAIPARANSRWRDRSRFSSGTLRRLAAL